MTTFINPLEALGLDPLVRPDASSVKRARRRMLVEVELADGPVNLGDATVERSDLLHALQDLDDERKVSFYHDLRSLPELNAFLKEGDVEFFRTGIRGSAFDESFVAFISPTFAARYGQAVTAAIRDRDVDLVQTLNSRPLLIASPDIPLADRPIDAELTRIRNDLEAMKGAVKAEDLEADDAATQSRLLVCTDALNSLPSRFSSQRTQIARALRNLAVTAFNAQEAAKPAYTLLAEAARLATSPDVAEDIKRQLEHARAARDHELLLERHSAEVEQCTSVLTVLHGLASELENESASPTAVLSRAQELITPSQFESIPEDLGDVVAQVAFALRGLAVAVWNEHSDGDTAQAVLKLALQMRLPTDARRRLLDDKKALEAAVKNRVDQIEGEKDDLRNFAQMLRSMMDAIAQHRGDQIRWPIVAEKLSELFTPDMVGWLKTMRPHAPTQVHQVLLGLAGPLAGLARYYPAGYDDIQRRLRPLTEMDAVLAGVVSRDSVRKRAEEDPKLRRATSGPAFWEQAWFWWVAVISFFMLMGQCA